MQILAKEEQILMIMTINTVEDVCCVTVGIFTGCVDVDVGFATTVFTGLLKVIDTALKHAHTYNSNYQLMQLSKH